MQFKVCISMHTQGITVGKGGGFKQRSFFLISPHQLGCQHSSNIVDMCHYQVEVLEYIVNFSSEKLVVHLQSTWVDQVFVDNH